MDVYRTLPIDFLEEIKRYFTSEAFEAFLASFLKEPRPALRINTDKFTPETFWAFFEKRYPHVKLTPVPWTKDAFFYEDLSEISSFIPGKEAAYLAGFYYVQEASAMLPAQVFDLKQGLVLDMCAAPGGKSTKLATLSENITLYSNDISKDRAMILLRNLEQYGLKNAVVLQEDAGHFTKPFEEQLDAILLDAPCSGEGMFRRDVRARQAYAKYQVEKLVEVQAFLLDCAVAMLKVGGELLYSTCTFNVKENEAQIYQLLKKYPELELLDGKNRLMHPEAVSEGVSVHALIQTLSEKEQDVDVPLLEKITKSSMRLWPHLQEADGHYAVLLRKKSSTRGQTIKNTSKKRLKLEKTNVALNKYQGFFHFAQENLKPDFLKKLLAQPQRFYMERDFLHYLPDQNESLNLEQLHVLKRGVLLGQEKIFSPNKVKFIPSHSFALAYGKEAFLYTYELQDDEEQLFRYIQGQSLNIPDFQQEKWLLEAEQQGLQAKINYILITYYGFPFGLAKKEGNILKNIYPKSWVR